MYTECSGERFPYPHGPVILMVGVTNWTAKHKK